MRSLLPILSAVALSTQSTHAFHAPRVSHPISTQRIAGDVSNTAFSALSGKESIQNDDIPPTSSRALQKSITSTLTAASILLGTATSAFAVSGGGLDYAGLDISNQDFSNGNYKGKDFTQTIAKAATFANSNLQGCRFYKSYLVNANFEGADARGASFEDTSMDNANLRNINAAGSYFGQSLLDVASLEGGDFTDASIPPKTLNLVCEREDVKGTNPTTGADTRDSLMCL